MQLCFFATKKPIFCSFSCASYLKIQKIPDTKNLLPTVKLHVYGKYLGKPENRIMAGKFSKSNMSSLFERKYI